MAPGAALELARIEYASMAIVTLAFPARDFPGDPGSGFLVPPVDGTSVKASTYSFAKWDWVRAAAADDGLLVMRCSLGRHREEQALQRPDDELVELALDDLADAIGLSVRPVDAHVQRWGGALPQYAVGHLDRVAASVRGVAACPVSRSAARRTTASGSRPASPRRSWRRPRSSTPRRPGREWTP